MPENDGNGTKRKFQLARFMYVAVMASTFPQVFMFLRRPEDFYIIWGLSLIYFLINFPKSPEWTPET